MVHTDQIMEAKRLAAGPLGEQLAKFPMLFASSVLIGQSPSKARASQMCCGSVSLLDLGQGLLVVTCQHVIAGYREMQKAYDHVIFQIGDAVFDPLEQLVDENARLDLATIRVTEEQAKQIAIGGPLGSCFFRPRAWPPEPLQQGQFIAFGGFPGSLRTVASFDELVFDSWSSGGSEVSSVSDGQFVSKFDRDAWVISFGAQHHLTLTDLGGLSGGPAFINRGLYWDFVGIVSNYHENYDAMFFSSSHRLRTDGTIAPLPV